MFLVKTDRKILKACCELQSCHGSYLFIDQQLPRIYRSPSYDFEDVRRSIASDNFVEVPVSWSVLDSSIQFLIANGFLNTTEVSGIFQVSHDGWIYEDVHRHEFVMLVLTHVLFPSFVAFVTTVITLALTQ